MSATDTPEPADPFDTWYDHKGWYCSDDPDREGMRAAWHAALETINVPTPKPNAPSE